MSKEPLKVLLITDLFPRYDGDIRGIFVLDYINATEASCRYVVINPNFNPENIGFTVLTGLNAQLVRVFGKPSGKGFVSRLIRPFTVIFKSILAAYRAKPFHIIHVHGAIYPGLIGYALSKILSLPMIVTEHTGPYSRVSSRRIVRYIAHIAVRSARRVTAVSQHLKNEMINVHGEPSRIDVIHNPIDTASFRYAQSKRNKCMLYVGRMDKDKGLQLALQMFYDLDAYKNGWTFKLVGDGPFEQELKLFVAHSLVEAKDQIEFLGPKDKSVLPELMNSAAFLVHLSRHESFGITIVEAISCGLPVLAGRNSAMLETVSNECGILVDIQEIAEVKNGMKQMMESWKQYDHDAMHEYATSRFGYKTFSDKMLKIYLEVTN